MLKIEIADQPSTKGEPVLKVRLEYDGKGGVDAVSVDETGALEFYLFGLTPKGTLTCYRGLPEELGLQLNNMDRIVVEGE